MVQLVLVLDNLRSAHNVGSVLRTADGLGVHKVYFTGYTPYPEASNDSRMPHEIVKVNRQIAKTSLGAEKHVAWERVASPETLIKKLASDGYKICALEQTPKAINIVEFSPPDKLALVLGSEVGGVAKEILKICDIHLKIPMEGQKDSFNVAVAAALAIHQLRLGKIS